MHAVTYDWRMTREWTHISASGNRAKPTNTAREIEVPPAPRPEDWGVSESEAAELLRRQMCPVCREGPWASPLNHVARKHAIGRLVMRDICGLSTRESLTAEDARAAWSANGVQRADVLASNSASQKGAKGRKMRRTKALIASLASPGWSEWEAADPSRMADMRAGFRARVTTPESRAKWEAAMLRVRADREPASPEQRAAFAKRMADPEVAERRRRARTKAEVCSVEGCTRSHAAKGLCKLHWNRKQRTGNVGEADPLSLSEAARKGRPNARRLTPEQVDEARRLYALGKSQREIGERLGVAQTIISRAVRGAYRQ